MPHVFVSESCFPLYVKRQSRLVRKNTKSRAAERQRKKQRTVSECKTWFCDSHLLGRVSSWSSQKIGQASVFNVTCAEVVKTNVEVAVGAFLLNYLFICFLKNRSVLYIVPHGLLMAQVTFFLMSTLGLPSLPPSSCSFKDCWLEFMCKKWR